MCTWDPELVLLLLGDTSFSRELNSLDNSSAVASDAFRSSSIVWTEYKPHKYHRQAWAWDNTFIQIKETYTACRCQSLCENSWLGGSFRLLKKRKHATAVWRAVSQHLQLAIFSQSKRWIHTQHLKHFMVLSMPQPMTRQDSTKICMKRLCSLPVGTSHFIWVSLWLLVWCHKMKLGLSLQPFLSCYGLPDLSPSGTLTKSQLFLNT